MRYITFHPEIDLDIAILAFELDPLGMEKAYIKPLGQLLGEADAAKRVVAYELPSKRSNKGKLKAPPVSEQREYLKEYLSTLQGMVKYLIVSQPDYFKVLTGSSKAALEVGNMLQPDIRHFPAHQDMFVCYVPNHKMMFFDPEKTEKGIETSLTALRDHIKGSFSRPGKDIIKQCFYPQTEEELIVALDYFLDKDITVDTETFSLDIHKAGIASVTICDSQYSGIAFICDYSKEIPNYRVRLFLRWFFKERRIRYPRAKTIYHQASFDVTILVEQLSRDVNAKQKHDIFDDLTNLNSVECTKIITYLATNSCAGNQLGLKQQSVEFAGNYAVDDIKDVSAIPVTELLEYNLVDGLSTWYTYNKNYPIMTQDQQESVYREVFLPSLVDVVDMQLTGLPVDMDQVARSKAELEKIRDAALNKIKTHPVSVAYLQHLKEQEVEKLHAKWVKKRTTVSEINLEFNPGSDIQLAGLLYDQRFMGLPVLGTTDSGAPSTKGKYLKALKSHKISQDIKDFLDAVIDYKDCAIMLSTFIPALEGAHLAPDGNYYMHGNFNLGGTLSGRLSSSDPNLQNLPSKSRLAKYIKLCIKAPKGWLFMGLDFDSLEDKISALLTKDPNKLKVYTDGYDGHSLRALSYFAEQMPDIDGSSVDSVNSIAVKYPELRQDSKAPTFLLTYGGTYIGMMENCGFSEPVAKQIESNYHTLYEVSDDFVAAKIQQASHQGYIEVAFGLRVRTPVLAQTVLGTKTTPNAAKAEARTAGNAIGQSWGLLNNRACSEFMRKVRQDPLMREHIRVCCQIHDAQYYLVRQDAKVVHWFNTNLVKAVEWQEHPAIAHPDVKLSGQAAIFYPNWCHENTLPRDASLADIRAAGKEIYQKFAA